MANIAHVAILKDDDKNILAVFGVVSREFTDRGEFNTYIATMPLVASPAPLVLDDPVET